MDADNTDGIIKKLVTVFALPSCPIDRFGTAYTAIPSVPVFNHGMP